VAIFVTTEIQLQGAGRRPSEDTQEPATKRPRKEPSNAQSPLTPSRCTTTRARRTRSGRGPEVKVLEMILCCYYSMNVSDSFEVSSWLY